MDAVICLSLKLRCHISTIRLASSISLVLIVDSPNSRIHCTLGQRACKTSSPKSGLKNYPQSMAALSIQLFPVPHGIIQICLSIANRSTPAIEGLMSNPKNYGYDVVKEMLQNIPCGGRL